MAGSSDDTSAERASARMMRGLVAGAIAGTVAAFAMDRFQAATKRLSPSSGSDGEEPATERAADPIAQRTIGSALPKADKPLAGQLVHYALGVGLGIAYGIAAEFRPSVTVGYGTAFGIGSATLLDEAAVPAAGLGKVPWETDPATTAYAYASHLVFGGVAEFVRRQVARTLEPDVDRIDG